MFLLFTHKFILVMHLDRLFLFSLKNHERNQNLRLRIKLSLTETSILKGNDEK